MNVRQRHRELAGVLATHARAARQRSCYDAVRLLKRRRRTAVLPLDFIIIGFRADDAPHLCIVPIVRTVASLVRAAFMQANGGGDTRAAEVDLRASFAAASLDGSAKCITCELARKATERRRVARLH